jgi:hypothetical protein
MASDLTNPRLAGKKPNHGIRVIPARAGCQSTLHTVFTSPAPRPQVMLATLGYRQHPQAVP